MLRSDEPHLGAQQSGRCTADTRRYGQQMQVVIAEHCHRAVAKRDQVAQRGEGFRPAIDDIAGEPEGRVVGGCRLREESAERFATTLQVAERERGKMMVDRGQKHGGNDRLQKNDGWVPRSTMTCPREKDNKSPGLIQGDSRSNSTLHIN